MMETKHDVRIIFQESDGFWPVEGKRLTDEEFEKLMELMPDTGWIVISNSIKT